MGEGGGEAGGKGENLKQTPCCVEPQVGLDLITLKS